MRININNFLAGLAMGIVFFCCICADALMVCLGTAFLPVTLSLVAAAYGCLRLSDRIGRRYILIVKK